MAIQGCYYVTDEAATRYLEHTGAEVTPEAVEQARTTLIARLKTARFNMQQRNGYERWRLTGKPRLYVVLSRAHRAEGTAPQIIDVLPEHAR